MRRHPDPVLEAAVDAVLSDPSAAGAATSYELRIGGVAVAPREIRYAAEDVREDDAPAMKLELTLPGFWPESLEGQGAAVDVSVDTPAGTAVYPEFRGDVFWVEETDGGDTTVEAYSPSTWLSEQENGEEITWADRPPRHAMHEAVSGIRYPRLDLSAVPTLPLLHRRGARVFEADAKRSERLADLRDEARVVFYDGPDGCGTGATVDSLTVPGAPAKTYAVGNAPGGAAAGTLKAARRFKGRYAAVEVRMERDDEGFDALRTVPIDNGAVYVPDHVVYPVEVTDASPEGVARTLDTGLLAARALVYGAWDGEASLRVLDPRLIRADTLAFEETKTEGSPGWQRRVRRRWLMVVGGYSRDPKNRTASLLGACLKVSERELPRPGAARAPIGGSTTRGGRA